MYLVIAIKCEKLKLPESNQNGFTPKNQKTNYLCNITAWNPSKKPIRKMLTSQMNSGIKELNEEKVGGKGGQRL